MKALLYKLRYFTIFEWCLWGGSLLAIFLSFFIFDGANYIALIASVIGATSLIFAAKGNFISPALMIIFCLFYGIISYEFSYYGELITYVGMALPMSVVALVEWLKNPSSSGIAEVKVNKMQPREWLLMSLLTLIVTVSFYFILRAFSTANLLFSTISVATSFAAAYLTFRRSVFFPLFYASNDLVLIILWTLASIENRRYVCVAVCFICFFLSDIYGFISWLRMEKRQAKVSQR